MDRAELRSVGSLGMEGGTLWGEGPGTVRCGHILYIMGVYMRSDACGVDVDC